LEVIYMLAKSHDTPIENKLALRVRDASVAVGLSRSTLCKLMATGKLRSIKIGGRRLILRADLEALLQAGVAE
jgi:excisionase family DNA binding protein